MILLRDSSPVVKCCYLKRKFGDLGRVQSYVLESRRMRGCREYAPFWMQAKSKQHEMSYPREKWANLGELIGIPFKIKHFNLKRNEFRSIQLNSIIFYKNKIRCALYKWEHASLIGRWGRMVAALSSTLSTYVHLSKLNYKQGHSGNWLRDTQKLDATKCMRNAPYRTHKSLKRLSRSENMILVRAARVSA